AGDFLTRDERQGNPWETAAQEPHVPRANARAVNPDQRLSRRWCWVGLIAQVHAVDPTQLLRQRYSHSFGLLTLAQRPAGPPRRPLRSRALASQRPASPPLPAVHGGRRHCWRGLVSSPA